MRRSAWTNFGRSPQPVGWVTAFNPIISFFLLTAILLPSKHITAKELIGQSQNGEIQVLAPNSKLLLGQSPWCDVDSQVVVHVDSGTYSGETNQSVKKVINIAHEIAPDHCSETQTIHMTLFFIPSYVYEVLMKKLDKWKINDVQSIATRRTLPSQVELEKLMSTETNHPSEVSKSLRQILQQLDEQIVRARPEPVDAMRSILKRVQRLYHENQSAESLLLEKLPEFIQLVEMAAAGDTRNINTFVKELTSVLRFFRWYGLYSEMEPLVQRLVTIARQRLPENREDVDSDAASFYADSLTWLSDLHQKLGRPDRSVSLMEEALTLVPKFGVMANEYTPFLYNKLYARALFEAGRIEDAESQLRKTLNYYRKQYKSRYWFNKPKALSYVMLVLQGLEPHHALKSQTEYAYTLELLGDLYTVKGQFEDANRIYLTIAQYFDEKNGFPVAVGRLYIKLSKVSRYQGDLSSAKSFLSQAETKIGTLLPPKSYDHLLLDAEQAAILDSESKPDSQSVHHFRMGIYQAKRNTLLRDQPKADAQVVARLRKGIKLQIVGHSGTYLRVRSRSGKPPGYVLRTDVVFLGHP